ncbi:Magnetosome protein MamA [Azospirillaceae bacterium]
MTQKISFPDAAGLYLAYGSNLASRLADRLISGFQSTFFIDEETKLDYYRSHGIEHAKAGRFMRALPMLDVVAEQLTNDSEVMLFRGLCNIKLGNKEAGMALLESARVKDAENPTTARILGIAYAQAGENEKALPLLTSAAEAFPENFTVQYRLGAILDNLGRHAEAVVYFERALKLRPFSTKVLRALAYSLEQLGEREKAMGFFKRADELEDSEGN